MGGAKLLLPPTLMGRAPQPVQARRLGQAQHQVGVLDRLASGPFDQVVDGGERDGDPAFRIGVGPHQDAIRADHGRQPHRLGAGGPQERPVGHEGSDGRRHVLARLAGHQSSVDGGQDSAADGQVIRREGDPQGALSGQRQRALDLRRVLVPQDAVGPKVAVDLAEGHVLGRLASRAGHPALGVDEDAVLLDDAPAQQRQRHQRADRRVAAGVRDQLGLAKVAGGAGLRDGVAGPLEQLPVRVDEPVPAWIFIHAQAESAGQVDHAGPGLQRGSGQRQRSLGRGPQEHQVHIAEGAGGVALGTNLEARSRTDDGKLVAQSGAGPLVADGQPQPQVRMIGHQAGQLHPGVTRHADDPDPDRRRYICHLDIYSPSAGPYKSNRTRAAGRR